MTRTPGLHRLALDDQPRHRSGREPLRVALAIVRGEVRGYAVFAREEKLGDGGTPEGVVRVRELQALDAASEAALWARLTDLDLMGTLTTGRRPLDDRLLYLLTDPRAAAPTMIDGEYVRIIDLPGP